MKNTLIGALSGLWLAGMGTADIAGAQDAPVIVELFTSQGCSSCPPADALLHKYSTREDVIALALHVDYWDYIGWKDTFADAAFTRRQKAYARTAGRRMVYTPQMIVGGTDSIVGHKPGELASVVSEHANASERVALTVERDGAGTVTIRAERKERNLGPLAVHLVQYTPEQTVDIRRGENRGRQIVYSNIVSRLEMLGRWRGEGVLSLSAGADPDRPVVILIQQEDHGPILAAARQH